MRSWLVNELALSNDPVTTVSDGRTSATKRDERGRSRGGKGEDEKKHKKEGGIGEVSTFLGPKLACERD